MKKTLIGKKVARDKYGVLTSRYDNLKYYLLENGKVIDSAGDTRYDPRTTQYDKLIDALNIIDEQAEQGGGDYAESEARAKAYELVADFIDKKAKR